MTVVDSMGIRIVTSQQAAWTVDTGWSVSPEPTVEIGLLEGDPPYLFDQIGDVARLPDGRLAIADGGSGEIRLFDRSGRHVLTLGGLGDGPGEFRGVPSFVAWRDSILAFDGTLARLTLFDLAGNLVETTAVEPTGSSLHPLRMYSLGGRVGEDLAMVAGSYPADMQPQPTVYWDSLPTLRYSREGALLDSIGEFSGMDTYSTETRAGSLTFGRFSSADVASGRLYMTDGGRYEVRVYVPDLGWTEVYRASLEPRPVTDATLEEYLRPLLTRVETPEQRRLLTEWPHAENLPWISRLVVDASQNIWVREYQHRYDPSPERWGVFSESGRWLGRMVMPIGFSPKEIGVDYVLGTSQDEFGVQRVLEYELSRDR